MEIKRSVNSAIQQSVTAQNTETSSNPAIQKGISNAKDGFEVARQNQFQATSFSPLTTTATALPAVQKHMLGYMSGQDQAGSLFALMTEYQKMMNKEHREDKTTARQAARSELEMKSEQLNHNNEAIARGMQEAGEKASAAMNEASLEYYIGLSGRVVKGDVEKDIDAMKKRLNELKDSADQIKEKLISNTTDQNELDKINTRYSYLVSWLTRKDDDD